MTDIAVYSLVDITCTNTTSNIDIEKFKRNQQRNWETAVQCLNLRNRILIKAVPGTPKFVELNNHSFGKEYSGRQRCWKFIFTIDYLFTDEELDRLRLDFHQVPVITGLEETVDLPDPAFITIGNFLNTYFKTT